MGGSRSEQKVFTVGRRLVVHVRNGRGLELQQHFASHGIAAVVSPPASASFERVEIEDDVDAEIVRAILDQWEG